MQRCETCCILRWMQDLVRLTEIYRCGQNFNPAGERGFSHSLVFDESLTRIVTVPNRHLKGMYLCTSHMPFD